MKTKIKANDAGALYTLAVLVGDDQWANVTWGTHDHCVKSREAIDAATAELRAEVERLTKERDTLSLAVTAARDEIESRTPEPEKPALVWELLCRKKSLWGASAAVVEGELEYRVKPLFDGKGGGYWVAWCVLNESDGSAHTCLGMFDSATSTSAIYAAKAACQAHYDENH